MFHIPRPKDGVYYSERFNILYEVEENCLYYEVSCKEVYMVRFTANLDSALKILEAKWIGEF